MSSFKQIVKLKANIILAARAPLLVSPLRFGGLVFTPAAIFWRTRRTAAFSRAASERTTKARRESTLLGRGRKDDFFKIFVSWNNNSLVSVFDFSYKSYGYMTNASVRPQNTASKSLHFRDIDEPRKIGDGRTQPHQFQTPRSYFRQQHFEMINTIIGFNKSIECTSGDQTNEAVCCELRQMRDTRGCLSKLQG